MKLCFITKIYVDYLCFRFPSASGGSQSAPGGAASDQGTFQDEGDDDLYS